MDPADDRDRTFHEEALPQMRAVFRYALRLTGDQDRAEDLAQETYLRAYRSWHRYQAGTRVKSWLFTICRNVFLREEERVRLHDGILARERDDDGAAAARDSSVFRAVSERDPEGAFWAKVVDDEVLRAVDALPPSFREAVVLCDLEGLSYEEVGELVEVPVGTVKSRLFRGRRLLEESLFHYAVECGIIEGAEGTDGSGTKRGT